MLQPHQKIGKVTKLCQFYAMNRLFFIYNLFYTSPNIIHSGWLQSLLALTSLWNVALIPIFYSAYPCPPSNLIIIINISADITSSRIQIYAPKETGSVPSLLLRTLPAPFYIIYFIANPTHCLNIFRPPWVILNFFPKAVDIGSDITVILEIFPIPDIIINLFFRKRYALMECQHIQDTEFHIGQSDFPALF